MLKIIKDTGGQVTVFLTLIFLVLVTIFFACLEIIRYEQAKGRVNHLTVGAVEHLMADYEVELADWYHIYALDTNYLGQGKEVMNHRVWDYLEQNLMDYNLFGISKGFYRFMVVDAQVEPEEYIYTKGCHSLKQQIKNWMDSNIIPNMKRTKRTDIKSNFEKTRKKKKPIVENNSSNKGESEKPQGGNINIDEILAGIDPRNAIEEIKSLGVLTVAYNPYLPLSKEIKQIGNMPSSTLNWEKGEDSLFEQAEQKLLLESYIFSHFQSALSIVREEETVYENEIEYLITGKNSDYTCLSKVSKEILLIRLPINIAAIMKDSMKKSEALGVATAICALTFQPEAVEGVQNAILLAWAYGESVAEVKCLLQGEKIPLIKNRENWKVAFHQLFYLKNASFKTSKEGMDYEDYLKILLVKVKEKDLYFRMLDLMQGNINLKYPEFQMKDCMTKYKVNTEISLDRRFFHIPIQEGSQYKFCIQQTGNYQYE